MAASAYSSLETRRDPDAILRQIIEEEQSEGSTTGKLKIFFGYAAGVGKTYAMLEAAHEAQRKGFDIVVGYVEPHTRPETTALVEGLEVIPPLEVKHHGITLREFDLDAVLERKPQIVLVDEFAHTNAPGSRHKKRFQDVEELLRAGISVFTTVNVQHIESLNDKVAAITEVQVAERIPDRVFDEADSVELVDIEPADLIERLQAGKIYIPERATTALQNFFSQKNLGALREIALRRMAERLSRKSAKATHVGDQRVEAGEDVLVYVTADPGNVKVIRAAATLASNYQGDFTAVIVETSVTKKYDLDQRGRLRKNADLAEELGASVVTLYGNDIAQQIVQYAQTTGCTHIVVGGAQGVRAKLLGREALPDRLIRLAQGSIVDVVPVKDLPLQYGRLREATGLHFSPRDVLWAAASVAVATALGMGIYELGLTGSVVLMLYLVASLLFATRAHGAWYPVLVSLGGTLAYNYFFTVPRFTFNAYGINYPFIFAFLLIGTLVTTTIAVRTRTTAESSTRRAYRMEVLMETVRKLQEASDVATCYKLTADIILKLFNRGVVMYELDSKGHLLPPVVHDVPGTEGGNASVSSLTSSSEVAVASWVASNCERAGATTDTLVQAHCLYLPITSKGKVFGVAGVVMDKHDDDDDFGALEKNLLLMIVDECGQATEQIVSGDERRSMEVRVEKETMRSNLLRSISHDLRTPLTSILGDADMLLHDNGALSDEQKQRMYRDIHDDSRWLITLVENLLSITRIDNGTLELTEQPELVGEVIREALQHVDRRATERAIEVHLEDELLMAKMDARLIMQVVINLVNNAVNYTPEQGKITVAARRTTEKGEPRVLVSVTDEGPGISEETRKHVFDMFYNGSTDPERDERPGDFRRGMGLGLALCRSIVEVHGGTMQVRTVDPHGSEFWFTLPAVEADDVVNASQR